MKPPIFLGQLLLRSMDRAVALYESMELWGFHGEFYYAEKEYNKLAISVKENRWSDRSQWCREVYANEGNAGTDPCKGKDHCNP